APLRTPALPPKRRCPPLGRYVGLVTPMVGAPPSRTCQPRPQSGLQLPVRPFHHPVELRVVGGGLQVLDPQQLGEACPQVGGKLAALV
ncbi:MAG: hypothetical protein ACK559_23475, partial [bacterium]